MRKYSEGKSGVNVKRLVQNISDQYPFEPQRAAIIELVANSLDARASLIEINLNKQDGILEIVDNGLGMDKRQFREYHDFAATTKARGKGIGFAGQGAKLALNFCKRVLSETWSTNYRGYSEWFLKGNDAPYKIFDGQLLGLDDFGTRVTLYLNAYSINFYTEELIKDALFEHYFPLIDPKLRVGYEKAFYKRGVKFLLNKEEIEADVALDAVLEEEKKFTITVYRKPKAIGIIGRIKNTDDFLPGIMICTYGKVIERTYFRKEPREKEKIVGWIEAPYLIEAVTTDKCRFQRGNKLWEGFFRKTQSEFSRWLEETGLLEKPVRRGLDYANLEREINSILKNLPELSFFSSRTQRDVAIPDINGEKRKMGEGIQKVPGTTGRETPGEGVPVHPGEEPGKAPTLELGEDVAATPEPRTVRGGIRVTEDERPDLDKEAWFDGETVTLNKSHPAYKKAKVHGVLNYHILKAAILGLIEFNIEKESEPSYQRVFELQQRFFKIWGEQ